jgi:hypothetical protein
LGSSALAQQAWDNERTSVSDNLTVLGADRSSATDKQRRIMGGYDPSANDQRRSTHHGENILGHLLIFLLAVLWFWFGWR